MVLTHGLSIIKLSGTEFIISHTFQFEGHFSFACPVKFDCIIGVILLDTVPNKVTVSLCLQRRDESLHCSLSSAYCFFAPSIIGRCKTDVTPLATRQ